MNPALIAFIIAVAFSFVESLKGVLLDQENILNETIFVSSNLIGKTVKVMSVFVFGAALPTYAWSLSTLSDMIHVLQAIVKLCAYPVLGIYIVFDLMFKSMGTIEDPILTIMMLIHFAAPTGVGLLTLVGQKGYMENDMGKSLTIQHIGALVTFTVSTASFMFLMTNHYQLRGMGMDIKI